VNDILSSYGKLIYAVPWVMLAIYVVSRVTGLHDWMRDRDERNKMVIKAHALNEKAVALLSEEKDLDAVMPLREAVAIMRPYRKSSVGFYATILYNLASAQCGRDRVDLAIPLLVEGVELLEEFGDLGGTVYVDLLVFLTETYIFKDRIAEGKFASERVFEAVVHLGSQITLSNIESLYELGGTLLRAGQSGSAEALWQKVLRMPEMLDGDEMAGLRADISSDLGNLLMYSDRFNEAAPLLDQALEIYARKIGDMPLRYGQVLDDRATVHVHSGEFEKALPLQRESIEITLHCQGNDSPEYAIGLQALAGIMAGLGRQDEARAHLSHAVQVMQDVLGADHPETEALRAELEVFDTHEND